MKIFVATMAALLAAGAVAQGAPDDPARPAPHDREMVAGEKYVCDDGHLLTLRRDAVAGLLQGLWEGEPFILHQQVTKGRPRFVNGADSIQFDGDALALRRGRDVRVRCALIAEGAAGVLWGVLEGAAAGDTDGGAAGPALPKGTMAKVLLVDSLRPDAPAVEIASTTLKTTGNGLPLWYRISYDADRARTAHALQLVARIEGKGGQLLYWTAGPVPVATGDGAPAMPIELVLAHHDGQNGRGGK